MSGHLVVEIPGLSTTVQDLGRHGHQDIGMPVSGALDPFAFRIANALVGNPPDTAALEIRMVGPQFRVEAEAVRVALAGTSATIEILSGAAQPVPSWQSVRLERGQRFRIGPMRDTTTCYLGIQGGLSLPTTFGSMSTYLRGGIGGFSGRALQTGDALPLALNAAEQRPERRLSQPPRAGKGSAIRVTLGPQAGHFTPEAIQTFLGSAYTISHRADRMGYRLEGAVLAHSKGYNIVSDGIVTGAIQVPGTGQPIILLADHQTSGGYPKIAVVISADLPRLASMSPGAKIRFQEIAVGDAEDICRRSAHAFETLLSRIHTVQREPRFDSEALLAATLISGVTSGEDSSLF